MAPIPITFVVNFTSQDDQHPAQNLLLEDSFGSNHWQCAADNVEDTIEVELQFLQRFKINYIDVGNYASATVQILVGLSSWPKNREFRCLLPTSVLMSPEDCKTMSKTRTIRMFTDDHLDSEVKRQEWDRVRIICKQPYKRGAAFGLSFVRFFTDEIDSALSDTFENCLEKEKSDGPQTSVAWERLKGLKSSFEPQTPKFMSRSARAVMAATSKNNSSFSTVSQLESQVFHSSQSTPPSQQNEIGEQNLENTNKRKTKITSKRNWSPQKKRKFTEKNPPPNNAQVEDIPSHFTNLTNSSQGASSFRDEDFLVTCPICTAEFTRNVIDDHVNFCLDNNNNGDVNPNPNRSPPPPLSPPEPLVTVPESRIGDEEELAKMSWVLCPLCGKEYEGWFISSHVNICADRCDRRDLKT